VEDILFGWIFGDRDFEKLVFKAGITDRDSNIYQPGFDRRLCCLETVIGGFIIRNSINGETINN